MAQHTRRSEGRVGLRSRLREARTSGVLALLGAALLALGLGCGEAVVTTGTAPGDSGASGPGSVSVFFTDKPAPDFDSIWLTVKRVELLGPDGKVRLFDGKTRFDLLRLRYVSELFSLTHGVPAGTYSKIRLELDKVELVWRDERGQIQSQDAKLTGGGKLDLEARRPIVVHSNEMLVVQVDVDGHNAVHVTETGNGKMVFRPVVFVDVVDAFNEDRLARVHGVIERIDDDASSFLLCRLSSPIVPYPDSSPASVLTAASGTASPQESDDDDDRGTAGACIDVVVLDDAALFDEDADPIDFEDLRTGDSVMAVGRLRSSDGGLRLLANVVVEGRPGSFALFEGTVSSPPDADDVFEVEAQLSELAFTHRVAVQLTPDTRILTRSGAEVGPEWLVVGRAVEVIGSRLEWSGLAQRRAKAAVVWVGFQTPGPDPDPDPGPGTPTDVSGIVTAVDTGAGRIDLDTDGGADCVTVTATTRIDLVTCTASGCTSAPASIGAVQPGQQAVAVGTRSGSACVDADAVVAFAASP